MCIHVNFYFYADLTCRILSSIWEFLTSALDMISQKKIPVFLLEGIITLTGSPQTLGDFGLGNDGLVCDPLSQIQKDAERWDCQS